MELVRDLGDEPSRHRLWEALEEASVRSAEQLPIREYMRILSGETPVKGAMS